MALLIDTLQQNKRTFNPNADLDSTGNYGIWDLTQASITYSGVNVSIQSFFTVSEYLQMRPDLIAQIKFGQQGKMGSLLKFNAISNPFSITEGQILAIPTAQTIDDSFGSKKAQAQKKDSNTNTNPANAFKKSQEQKKFKVSEGRKKFLDEKIKNNPGLILPPNVLQPGEATIQTANGFLIFAPNAGGGGTNAPVGS
jgi:hypothetical protein